MEQLSKIWLTNWALAHKSAANCCRSGKQAIFGNRVHWAKTYLAQAGLIENTRRGHFKITPRGQQALAAHPSQIDNVFLSQFEEFQQFKRRARASHTETPEAQIDAEERAFTSETETPDEIMRRAHKQIDAALAQDLLDRIRSAPPEFFERLIVSLISTWVTAVPTLTMQAARLAALAMMASTE